MQIFLLKLLYGFLILSHGLHYHIVTSSKCDRIPSENSANKSPSDGRYKLRILGDPEQGYVPGENYTISLEGILRASHGLTHKFTGFFVTVERDVTDGKISSTKIIDEYDNVGTFHIISPAISKFSELCLNLITHTNSLPKSDVPITWTAPPKDSGCVVFKATVIEHRDLWYMDEGALSKTFCEDEPDAETPQSTILEECRACDEAKYELTFEGLWSRNTHPKDFPSNGLTKFSDVIGASHTTEYRFWTKGEQSSEGLREIAELGSTRQLERELKEESEHIRTIIKARGISYPNVTGKTFAVFRVDAQHHLVSLVSMIYPSPDWFVGVSGLELCLSNGSWVEQKVISLYPYDAGTDSGMTYISPDQPTIPKEAIKRIKSNNPNDIRSPFYDSESKEMKPLAKLNLSRQRLYEKNCDNIASAQDSQSDCAVGKWNEWSACNSQCGKKGRRSRQRYYLNPQLAYQKNCKKKLTDHEECYGSRDICDEDDFGIEEDYSEQNPDPKCVLTEWSLFGDCSAKCGRGQRSRIRRYKIRKNHKRCMKMFPVVLEQFIDCIGESCSEGDKMIVANAAQQKPQVKKLDNRCRVSDWSKWSPCTVTCGLGERMRVRVPIEKDSTADDHVRKIFKLFKKFNTKNNKYRNEIADDIEDGENSKEKDEELSDLEILGVSSPKHPCINVELVQKQTCGMRNKPCEHEIYGTPPFCMLDPKPGACRSHVVNRWYYDKYLQDCASFPYTGCHGNKNNFESKEQCHQICAKKHFTSSNSSLQSFSHTVVKAEQKSLQYGEKIDCEVTHWKRTACNVTCGEGYRWKSRAILRHSHNGGTACPKRLVRLERCYVNCLPKDEPQSSSNEDDDNLKICTYSTWSAWSPCSKTCGDSAVQIRTRSVLNHPQPHLCTERLQERRCEVMPCLVENPLNYI